MKKYLIYLFLILGSTLNGQDRFEFEHQQMGTQIRLVFYAPNQTVADSVAQVVFSRIDSLNGILSDYIEESELSRLCQHAKRDVIVSHDLYKVLFEAVKISERSKGAFDITAKPLVRLWKKAGNRKTLPTKTEIKNALVTVGYGNIAFPKKNVVKLKKEGMSLDVGGIGKGYAADEALKILSSFNIKSALIDMGGDIVVGDPPPNKEYWTIAFYYNNGDGKEITKKIKLKNRAIATSGDSYQFMVFDGVRYSHIVNPKTGMALSTGIQVTVIATSGILADGYASAFSIMGVATTREKINELNGLETFITEQGSNEYSQWSSDRFQHFVLED